MHFPKVNRRPEGAEGCWIYASRSSNKWTGREGGRDGRSREVIFWVDRLWQKNTSTGVAAWRLQECYDGHWCTFPGSSKLLLLKAIGKIGREMSVQDSVSVSQALRSGRINPRWRVCASSCLVARIETIGKTSDSRLIMRIFSAEIFRFLFRRQLSGCGYCLPLSGLLSSEKGQVFWTLG